MPKHFMGRVSTLFSIAAILLQVMLAPVVVGVARNIGMTSAIFIIASMYLFAAASAWLSGKTAGAADEPSELTVTAGH